MLRRFLRRSIPNADKVRDVRVLRIFGDRLFHPALWHLNRRSAAGGVAVGLFCGLIPGPLQMLSAALAAVGLRVNLPLALFTTLYTNPFTIVPLYLVAYRIGAAVLGAAGGVEPAPPPSFDWTAPLASVDTFVGWLLGLGTPLAVGLVLLASILSVTGYLLVRGLWSLNLRLALRARRRRARSLN